MEKQKRIVLSVLICLGFLFSLLNVPASSAQEKEKVIELKFANFFPPPSRQSKIAEDFIADLEQRTGGKVKVKYFAGGSLLKPTTMIDGIEKGIADIGISHIDYTPGRMPVMEAAELPLGYPSGLGRQPGDDGFLPEVQTQGDGHGARDVVACQPAQHTAHHKACSHPGGFEGSDDPCSRHHR